MPGITDISPEILRDKHRLSSRQINQLYGYNIVGDNIVEKLKGFELVSEFFSVCDTLNSHNIAFIPFKGPVLSYRISGDAVTRSYHDLDLLIDLEDISKSVSLLKESGYRGIFIEWPDSLSAQRRLIRHINHVTLVKPENKLVLELHWRLIRTPAVRDDRFNNLVKNNLSTLEFGGRSFTVLNNELELLYLIIHGGLHFWFRLKWLLDINLFLRSTQVDWIRFKELVAGLKAQYMVGLCTRLYAEYFPEDHGIPAEYPVHGGLAEYSVRRINDTVDQSNDSLKEQFRNFYFTMAAFPGIRYKMKEIGNYLFISFYFGKISHLLKTVLPHGRKFIFSQNSLNAFDKVSDQ
jgi:hypothetical protein